MWWDCRGYDKDGNPDRGIATITLYPIATGVPSAYIDADPAVITLSVPSTVVARPATIVYASPVTITLTARGEGIIIPSSVNWIKWSDIGNLDFTINPEDTNNVAGEMPLPWYGWIYEIKKLGKNVIVYGENGISVLTPLAEPAPGFGEKTLLRHGLKGRLCVAGNDDVHFFIDRSNMLYKFTSQGLTKLDYSEFLSEMSASTVLSYDEYEELLYICDGTYGYVLSDSGLGTGPATITGMGRRGTTFYVTSSDLTMYTEPLQITTDTLDFGVRTEKTVYWLEIGTDQDIVDNLQAKLFSRRDKDLEWTESDWETVQRDGRVPFNVTGVEFRISVRAQTYEYFEIDYINVIGKTPDMKEVRA